MAARHEPGCGPLGSTTDLRHTFGHQRDFPPPMNPRELQKWDGFTRDFWTDPKGILTSYKAFVLIAAVGAPLLGCGVRAIERVRLSSPRLWRTPTSPPPPAGKKRAETIKILHKGEKKKGRKEEKGKKKKKRGRDAHRGTKPRPTGTSSAGLKDEPGSGRGFCK